MGRGYSDEIMQLQSLFQPVTVAEITSHTWCSRCITRSDRHRLMLALLEGWLSQEELCAIDRLLHAVRRGWLKVVD